MFRTIGDRPSLWETRLPAEVLRLPEELARVDALLDDPVFFVPFVPYFHPVIGRPSTPVECYLRLMFLKFRYRLGLESLCAEVPKALSGRMRARLRRALGELAVTAERTAKIVAQTRSRLAGQLPESATRLVSLHDPDARPIRKGRIDRPVEFGYKAQVADNDDGVVLDYSVEYGAAPDGPQLAPAVKRVHRRASRVPYAVTADRGYG
jgi:IS5 family transposase